MNAEESRLSAAGSRAQQHQASPKFFRLSHLRRLKGCEQVAAVCYRVRGGEIEFLLVQTRGGRWTFPKGSTEPGLTHAQAAALEAFEEAGVHGRMEEAAFARYVRRKRSSLRASSARPAEKDLVVNAHLCEVTHLESPQEADRHPTWFSAGKAKRRLREGRKPDYGSELARVLSRAVARVQQLLALGAPDRTKLDRTKKDALQRVQFAAPYNLAAGRSRPSRSRAQKSGNVFVIDQF
jgi:8-oxo-dGTP pyrophosphatase MutT (NUDIX family)